MVRNSSNSVARGFRVALLVFLACALSMSAVALGACAGSQTTEKEIVIKVPRTGHDVTFDDSISQIDQVLSIMADDFEQSYEGANVKVDVQVFEQNQYDSALGATLETDKAPDIIYGDYFNISTYVHSGKVVPLDDVVSQDIRDGIYDYLWEMSTVDGRIYMIPYLIRQNVLGYNKELFEQAGLADYIDDEAIGSWTLDEWTYILDTLAANLPEAAYPMMMYAKSSQGDTHTMTLLRAAGSGFFDDDGYFNISSPEGISALKWIQSGVSRGWYPPHCENLEIEDCSSLFRSGQLALYMVNNASLERYGDTIGLVNFPGTGEGCATAFISGFEVLDNGDPEKLQIAKDFISYVYGNERLMSYAAGALPASIAVAQKYKDQILEFTQFRENASNVVDFSGNIPNTRAIRDIFYRRMQDLLSGNATPEETAAAIDEQCNAAIDVGKATSKLHK